MTRSEDGLAGALSRSHGTAGHLNDKTSAWLWMTAPQWTIWRMAMVRRGRRGRVSKCNAITHLCIQKRVSTQQPAQVAEVPVCDVQHGRDRKNTMPVEVLHRFYKRST